MKLTQVVILTALVPEARAIARAFSWGARTEGTIGNAHVQLRVVGPSAKRLNDVSYDLNPQALIIAGLGGGLAPHVHVGDVVVDGEPPMLQAPTVQGYGIHQGPIVTSNSILTTPEAKARLFAQTQALAVDMEGDLIKEWARSKCSRILHLRAISDAAADFLSPEFLHLVDAEGRPHVGKALSLLSRHPTKLPELLRIGKASKVALLHLTATVRAILEAGWPTRV